MTDETCTVAGRPIVIRRATIAEILPLRHEILRPGRPRHTAEFDGDLEPATRHFGAFLAGTGEIVGCVSFMRRPFRDAPAYQLRGMATRADLARRGVGTALLAASRRALAGEGGPRRLWCNARVTAAPFYERLGWTIVSEPFDIPDVGPHVVMTIG